MDAETSSSSRNGGFVSDKVTQVVVESDEVGLLGLKLQRTESYPYKSPMTLHHHRSVDSDGAGGCFLGAGGPSFCSCRTDIYDIVGGGGGAVGRTVQPFNTTRTATSAFKSPGIMGPSSLSNFPFTVAQWQELERQALIFKHMMASIPVPPDLLLPISRNLSSTTTTATSTASASSLGRGGGFNMRYSSNTDPEPGRCRRTDGKKWRCSRDVAPDQKYCERHMHRGRPRSRKHVEVQSQITNNNNNTEINSNFVNKPDFKVPSYATMAASSSPYYKEPSVDWMMKGGNQDLQQLVQMKLNSTTTTSSVLQQNYQENLNLSSYNTGGHLFLNNELGSFEEERPVRQFIDAWSSSSTRDDDDKNNNSTEPNNKSSISANGKLMTLSNLSLSMSGSNAAGEIIDQTASGGKSLPLSWMNPIQCLACSPPGGPLGEVLQSSAAAASSLATRGPNPVYPNSMTSGNVGLNLMTDNWGGGGGETSGSPRVPAISSPSGVLQRTLASLSDSSGGSSPTFKAATAAVAKSEIGLQQVSYSK